MDILLLVLHPPLAAHLECETVLSDVASESDRLLPIAKFDMIISTQGKDQRNEIMIKINGNTSIESTLSVSSKTEKSVNQRLPSMLLEFSDEFVLCTFLFFRLTSCTRNFNIFGNLSSKSGKSHFR